MRAKITRSWLPTTEPFEKALPFPENHWSVRKTSPSPLLLLRGTGTIREPLHSMSPSVLSNTNHTLGNNFLKKPPWNKEMNGLHKWDKTKFKIVILKSGNNLPSKFFWQSQFDKILNLQVQGPFQKKIYFAVVYHSTLPTDSTLKIKKSVWIYLHLIKFKLPLLPTWEPFLNQPYDHEPFNTPPVLQSFLEKEEHIAVNHIISLWDLDKLTLARQTASNDVKLTLNCEHKRNEEERTNKKASKNKSFTTLKEVKPKNFDARFIEFNKFEKRSGRRKGLIFSFDSLKFDTWLRLHYLTWKRQNFKISCLISLGFIKDKIAGFGHLQFKKMLLISKLVKTSLGHSIQCVSKKEWKGQRYKIQIHHKINYLINVSN